MTKEAYIFIIKYTFILWVISIMLYFINEIIYEIRLRTKFNNITISSINNSVSLIDILINRFKELELLITGIINKIPFIKTYIIKYDKYSSINNHNNALTFLRKIEVGFLISLLYIIYIILFGYKFNLGLYVIIFIVSSYLLEISLFLRKKRLDKYIDHELYNTINILNNALKSGKTINQSIDYLLKEIEGPIKEEFILVKKDLDHGLSVDEAFSKMSKRCNNKDLVRISNTLSLLSLTGGDITYIFNYIEKDILVRKELKLDYSSSTIKERIIYKILLVLPIIVILFMISIYSNYLKYFITTYVGIIVLVLICSLYSLYIILINNLLSKWEEYL